MNLPAITQAALLASTLLLAACRCDADPPPPLTLPPAAPAATKDAPAPAAAAPQARGGALAGTPDRPATSPPPAAAPAPSAAPAEEPIAGPEHVSIPLIPPPPEPGKPGDMAAFIETLYPALASGDAAAAGRLLWDEVDWHAYGLPGSPMAGKAAVLRSFDQLRAAFSDLSLTPSRIVEGPRFLLVQLIISGTHTGPFLGVAPTGKRISFNSVHIMEVSISRVRRAWAYPDTWAFLVQAGAVDGEAPGAAPTKHTREVVERHARGSVEALDEFYKVLFQPGAGRALQERGAPGVITYDPTTSTAVAGPRGGTKLLRRWAEGLSDLQYEFDGLYAFGTWGAARGTLVGTHRGRLPGIARPTGKTVRIPVVDVFQGGPEGFASIWVYRNEALLRAQLGLLDAEHAGLPAKPRP